MSNLLIVEDEAIIRMALRKLLERHNYQVCEADSIQEATRNHNIHQFDLIISDLRLPGEPGTELIKLATGTPVLIMTSYASLRSAVDAMRMGAFDYIAKPFDHDEMIATVKRILEESATKTTTDSSTKTIEQSKMIGNSAVMMDVFHQIDKVAPTNATILIEGETGTGKELVARAIQQNSSRAKNPLISINCAAIPETLIESELFGHEKGAFTGAASQREGLIVAANQGTLFLDEIGELPLEAQARLLRVLQEGEVRAVGSTTTKKVDIRLVAATHRDLQSRCQEGLFREDLFFRLNVIKLQIPPLRERGQDIITLAESLLVQFCHSYGKTPLKLSDSAKQAVLHYHWPGNVRELENTMQRAVILCEHTTEIEPDLLNLHPRKATTFQTTPSKSTAESSTDLSLQDYFQRFVIENQDDMSETELAKRLGISRKCLWERRHKYGIPRKKSAS